MVVSLNKGIPMYTPTYYSTDYGDPPKSTTNSWETTQNAPECDIELLPEVPARFDVHKFCNVSAIKQGLCLRQLLSGSHVGGPRQLSLPDGPNPKGPRTQIIGFQGPNTINIIIFGP